MSLLSDAFHSFGLDTPDAAEPRLDILDLRHFTADRLRPLLEEEATRWQRDLHWQYTAAAELLLEYIGNRVLPGLVAVEGGQVMGYGFAVTEADKAIIGDVYAFGEASPAPNPVCQALLPPLLEMLQATPGIGRIEAQLLLFPAGALADTFAAAGFERFARLFMAGDLASVPSPAGAPLPAGLVLDRWQPAFTASGAELIHRAYAGHVDSGINNQYRSVSGSAHFLHNIVSFPGCGQFLDRHSWVLRREGNAAHAHLEAMLLTSQIAPGVVHVTQLCLSPELRGHGLGQRLLAHAARQLLVDGFGELSLTVTVANATAVHVYERCGLRVLRQFDAYAWEAE